MAEIMYFLVLRLSHAESGSYIWTRCTTGDCGRIIDALSTVSSRGAHDSPVLDGGDDP